MPTPFQMQFDLGLRDINPITVGERSLRPGTCVKPPLFNATTIFLTHRGEGAFQTARGTYAVREGEAFLALPGEEITCLADGGGVWEYAWVGFNGKLAYRFSSLGAVFTPTDQMLRHLHDLRSATVAVGLYLTADLLALYAKLPDGGQGNEMIQKVLDAVKESYMQNLSVQSLALQFQTNGKRLSHGIKERTGMPLRAYITAVRIEHAKKLLEQGVKTTEVSARCGFNSPSNFHKTFTDRCGMTPMRWSRMYAIKK